MPGGICSPGDHPVNLKLINELLELEGYETFKSEDAENARELLDHVVPDLILMDVALPGMDGLQLTRILREDNRMKNVKIVAVTAFAMKGDMERAMAAGCGGFITKPIDTRTLFAR